MKIQGLRKLLFCADRDLLEKAFIESYKQFSKVKKEEIDLLICDILEGKENEVVLAKGLNTEQARKIAMEEAKKIIEEKKKKYHSIPDYDNRSYELREDINHLCGIVLLIEMEMEKIKEGIQYYFTNYEKYKNELGDIVLYKALDLAEMMETEKEWIEIYEYAVKKRIRPRNELAFEYQKRKK